VKSFEAHIRPYLQNAIDNNLSSIEELPDSLIFGVKIDVRTKTVIVEKAEWGEYLAYGDTVKKETVPEDMLSIFELNWAQEEKHAPHLMAEAMMTTTILDFAKKNSVVSIGGTVILVWADKSSLKMAGTGLTFAEKNTRVKVNGQSMPLIPFNHYPNMGHSQTDMGLFLLN
jgi:hypothetical protein